MQSQEQVLRVLPDLLTAGSTDQVKELCQRYIGAMGFDSFLILVHAPAVGSDPEHLITTTYPEAWIERYHRAQWWHHDPVIRHCASSPVPLVWHRERFQETQTRHLFEESSAYGVATGVASALRGINSGQKMMMSVACDAHVDSKTEAWLSAVTPSVHLLAAYAYEALCRTQESGGSEAPVVNLTERERECLRWAAAGKTSWETSQILSCSEATVNFHLRNVIQKLSASNRRQAVARALSLGLIHV
ncbi:autoinducer binding domain-containing protein [Caldimonas brevitalea]|uniref:Transcriptional regulator, LuxR family n=1 Tax=Caldimonas brevitalea TaxID=413882 RepID=A0A0G3BG13_9BURK|nr:autoinducer binding domain-containing protein [Caldimonas brevitalea]AKJ26898.1 transcriptional regulator, LuxR family [Caldimonas brevitalea]